MKKTCLTVVLLVVTLLAMAQRTIVSGTVSDHQTGRPIAQASVSVAGTSIAVVTNDDGFFTLKTEQAPQAIYVSHLGYQARRISLNKPSAADGEPILLDIQLKATSINLGEVVVWPENPRQLVDIAISKIPANYSRRPELFKGFYRETAMKRQHYIYVAEGVVDMYKSAYGRDGWRDGVAIVKGRRLLSPKQGDTLSMKVMGGPVLPVQLDVVKNTALLLNAAELDNYFFSMGPPTQIDGRQQYVVGITPRVVLPYPLYYGRLYIDRETLAFTRVELELDMSDRAKATQFMLVKKPAGVRFKPKELSVLIDYKQEGGVTRISYVRNTFRFNCDWKRRLFSTSFTAFCEMVVTDRYADDEVHPIKGRDTFDSRDMFYDRVDYFRDPQFWEDYNIIEPSTTLDKAIGRIMKRYE